MSPTTLADMLDTQTTDRGEDPLQWMVLTWDLAKISDRLNQCVRFFITADATLATTARRTPRHFSREDPLSGVASGSRFDGSDRALDIAIAQTTSRLSDGYGMVCRPLAVDCFDCSHTVIEVLSHRASA